jgi:hypothetical protein
MIESAPEAEKGTAVWQGKGIGFRVRDGRLGDRNVVCADKGFHPGIERALKKD